MLVCSEIIITSYSEWIASENSGTLDILSEVYNGGDGIWVNLLTTLQTRKCGWV